MVVDFNGDIILLLVFLCLKVTVIKENGYREAARGAILNLPALKPGPVSHANYWVCVSTVPMAAKSNEF